MSRKAACVLHVLAVATLINIARAAPEQTGDNSKTGVIDLDPLHQIKFRIVGGTPADIHDFGFIASWMFNGRHFCAASLLTEEWLISAAHCFAYASPDLSFVRVGSVDINLDDVAADPDSEMMEWVQTSKAVGFFPYSPFTIKTFSNDIGLVKVSPPFKFNEVVRPIPIINFDAVVKPGDTVTTAGWGKTQELAHSLSPTLQRVDVLVRDSKICQELYNKLPVKMKIRPNMICANAERRDSCQGDSGGPLLFQGKLLGLVSFGSGCARITPGVYTDLRHPRMRAFIANHTGLALGGTDTTGVVDPDEDTSPSPVPALEVEGEGGSTPPLSDYANLSRRYLAWKLG